LEKHSNRVLKNLEQKLEQNSLKLGIKAGVVAVGAATGPPGWIVAAISVVADVVIALD